MTKDTLIRVDLLFRENIKRAYPNRSDRERTKELNKILEDIIYGNKTKKI